MWISLVIFNNMQKVSIIGLGYVGLPLLLAIERSKKYEVQGFDISDEQVEKIKNKDCPITDEIAEKDLQELDVRVTTDENTLEGTDIFIICVPTPIHDDYTPDYGPVESASKTCGKYLKKGATIILESTVNPGTCEEIVLPIVEEVSGMKGIKDFNLGFCPERINPGDPKWNVYNINRNIGSLDIARTKELADFYRSFLDAEVNECSSLKVAEATKIVENTFRDINIAYVNELAKSFDSMGIDLQETLKGASNKPFAFMAHWPGCGVGGHCIAVDPYYLIKRATLNGFNHRFLKAARDINNSMPKYTVGRVIEALNEIGKSVKGTRIALLGLSYKQNVADLRESPSFEILKKLEKMGAEVNVFDPYTSERNTYKTFKETLENSEAIVLCTAHDEFKDLSAEQLLSYDINVVLDGRNCLDKELIEKENIIYRGIGR